VLILLGLLLQWPTVLTLLMSTVLVVMYVRLTRRGEVVPLTAREFALLTTLAAHPGGVFTRAQLLERVWGSAYYDDHVVDVHVGNLRRKLEDDPAHPRYVATVRGVGYRLGAPAPPARAAGDRRPEAGG
jgi:DNA-binding response OmpR family regulator